MYKEKQECGTSLFLSNKKRLSILLSKSFLKIGAFAIVLFFTIYYKPIGISVSMEVIYILFSIVLGVGIGGTIGSLVSIILFSSTINSYTTKLFNYYEKGKSEMEKNNINPKVLILYPTCDDFIKECALFALDQEYKNCELCILDDSKNEEFKNEIDAFVKKYKNVSVTRRKDNVGWKGGNLKNFTETTNIKWDYIVIIDADILLPRNFVSLNIPLFYSGIENLGFIQSEVTGYNKESLFGRIVKDRINCAYNISQLWQTSVEKYCTFIDWGVIVSRETWDLCGGGYDGVVNSDTSVLAACFNKTNKTSIFSNMAPVSSMEPLDMPTFWKREKRWWLAQIDFWRKIKYSSIFKNKSRSLSQKIGFYNFFPSHGLQHTCILVLISTILVTLYFVFFSNISTIAGTIWVWTIIFWLSLCAIRFMVGWIKMRSFRYAVSMYAGYLIFGAAVTQITFIYCFRYFFHITKKVTYYVSDKKSKRMSLAQILKFNIIRMGFFFLLTSVGIGLFFVNKYCLANSSFTLVPISMWMFIISFTLLITFLSTFLSNINIKKNDDFTYEVYHANKKLRQRYNIPILNNVKERLKNIESENFELLA